MSAAPQGHRPFAWSGYCSLIPESFRLTKATGHADAGQLVLSDDDRNRLEMAWGHVRRRRFDARKVFVKRISSESDVPRDQVEATLDVISDSSFDPLLHWADKEKKVDHYLGYAPETRRVVHLTYQRESAAEDAAFRDVFLRHLVDQPIDQPQMWAFFSVSFVAPPKFRHQDDQLNIGDMTVHLTNKVGWYQEERLMVRQIYPARLALGRKNLEAHTQTWLLEKSDTYRPKLRWLQLKRIPILEGMRTSRGPAFTATSHLRWLARPFLWRWPRLKRTWMVHDEAVDRLLLFELGGKSYPEPRQIEQLLDGVHWAMSDEAAGSDGSRAAE